MIGDDFIHPHYERLELPRRRSELKSLFEFPRATLAGGVVPLFPRSNESEATPASSRFRQPIHSWLGRTSGAVYGRDFAEKFFESINYPLQTRVGHTR